MAQELLFQTNCGASGDMILAAMLDLLDAGGEFKQTFENIGLAVTVTVKDTVKNHLKCKKITIAASPTNQTATFAAIKKFIRQCPFSERIKANASRVFNSIFAAEAAVHGLELKNVHLHEIGADDSLIDILGFCFLWEKLDCCPIYFTTLVTGRGDIQTRHGLLPVPPPAVLRLIQGLAYRGGDIEDELLTPTAAAILTTCGRQAEACHIIKPLKTGVGCGHKSFAQVPNILRAILSEKAASASTEQIWVLEFNLDDMTGEMLAVASEKIMQTGAVDIFISGGLMKKGRPGFMLTVLCEDQNREQVIATIFRESTAIGLRQRLDARVILQREMQTVTVAGQDIRVKISSFQNQRLNIKPEFADVCRLATEKNLPVKQALQMVQGAMHEKYGS